MKTLPVLLPLVMALPAYGQTVSAPATIAETNSQAQTEYSVVEEGANYRVWQRNASTTTGAASAGGTAHGYVQLETGLNYLKNGKWVAADPRIEITTNGGLCATARHTVRFAPNINVAGAVDLTTPDGKRLRSHILGLSYFDYSSGKSVLIAELKDSEGQLLPSEREVLYTNCFTDVDADALYKNSRKGLEQFIVIRSMLPSPSDWGLDPSSTTLQVLTEFLDPPIPATRAITNSTGELDTRIDFGLMKMGLGKAFLFGEEKQGVPVRKYWKVLNSRTFLIEEVPFVAARARLARLGAAGSGRRSASAGSHLRKATVSRVLPPLKFAEAVGPLRRAKAPLDKKGFAMDYDVAGSTSDFTFQADKTYLITGGVALSGTTTIEGLAVIKFDSSGSGFLSISDSLKCDTGPYRPAVFTASDDNSVGETISGSTGSPSGTYADTVLLVNGISAQLSSLRVLYAYCGVYFSFPPDTCGLTNCQFVGCSYPIIGQECLVNGGNILVSGADTAVYGDTEAVFNLEHVTAVNCGTMTTDDGIGDSALNLTNSLLVDVGSWGNFIIHTNYIGTNATAAAAFQTVGGGSYYLATNSPYRNAGTTNVSILSEIQSRTTYPPIVYSNATISSASYSYDAHRRQSGITDARNGTTTYGYNNADLVTSVKTPSPGSLGGSPQTTLTIYNSNLQATSVLQPDGSTVSSEFYPDGLLKRTYGSRTYPVGYGYDAQGRMTRMTNWSSFSSGSGVKVTAWNYDPYRGWLASKRYPDSTGPDYTYTPGGRLATRTWARTGTGGNRIVSTYSYGFNDSASGNEHGDLVGISYANDPQSTPSVAYTYDRRGRQTTIQVGTSSTSSLTYNDANEPLTESFSGGTLDGLSVTNGYDQFLRRTNLAALASTTSLLKQSFAYDAASRLQTVADNSGATAYSATYTYVANSSLVGQIVYQQNTTTRMTTTKQYDYLNRLTSISSVGTGSTLSPISFAYSYNNANQRTRCATADGSFWVYQYDSLGQVISGKKYWPDFSPVAGQQFEYGFDDIGNRTQTEAGGDAFGANLRTASYSANDLNQYTSRSVPGAFDVIGLALANEAVTVNSSSAYRHGEYFRKEVDVANSAGPVWEPVSVAASGETTVNGNVFVPKTPEAFYYDLDGNLTNDGRWTYYWDAENRLVQMAANTGVGPQISLKFEYDALSRRIRKQVWANTSWTGTPTNDVAFVYDGWNLVAVLNATNHAELQSFLWGLDLSGTMQGSPRESSSSLTGGAGGVGGLIALNDGSGGSGFHFAAFDGNGNVSGLIKASDGTASAVYEYGPFGEVIRTTGPMAKLNPLRFSTKYQDDETDLLYYGYRYYNASTGRWASRDMAEEGAGFNVYGFVDNRPISASDYLGLVIETTCAGIDDYLNSLGVAFAKAAIAGGYRYSFDGKNAGTGDASPKLILTRMLLTHYIFRPSTSGGSEADNLKQNVEARLTIVRNALNANFVFGTGHKLDWTGFRDDPQAFFNRLNNGATVIACQALSRIIFETGNRFGYTGWAEGQRPYDHVWIPGDWGYIENKAYVPGTWDSGLEGENVFHTGTTSQDEMFWGHFTSGKHPSMSEHDWWEEVKSWSGGGESGDPHWRKSIKFPVTGLQR